MTKGSNNMDTKSDEQLTIIQSEIEANKQYMKANKKDSDDKITKFTEDFKAML